MKVLPISELALEYKELVVAAREATSLSYSPYSHFCVGAAVLLDGGMIVRGANQENASYPVGICAERSALATAQNLYPNVAVIAMALAAHKCDGPYTEQPVTPCGMCRQVMAECERRYGRNMEIIMTSHTEAFIATGVQELLPMAFS